MREPSDRDARSLLAVEMLQRAYGDAVTRRAWDEVASLFEVGARVHIDTRTRPVRELEAPDELIAFIASSLESFSFFEFTILNAVASVHGDEAIGRVYICEQRCSADGAWTQAYGLYQDEYRRRDGDWQIHLRRYHSLARTGPPIETFPIPPLA